MNLRTLTILVLTMYLSIYVILNILFEFQLTLCPYVVSIYFIYLFLFFKENPPYNKGAFRIEINFPAEYPFKPPKINFKTKIYHPNIDEKGQVCLPIISPENWKPATKTDQGKIIVSFYLKSDTN